MTFTVIKTSGWQGDCWQYVDEFSTRKEAELKASEVSSPNARQSGYIVAIVGDNHACDKHEACRIADTSRVKTDRHLRSRKQHIHLDGDAS